MSIFLVTGSSGYLGSLIALELQRRDHNVRLFDLEDPPGELEEFEVFKGDVRDKNVVEKACSGVDIVIHSVAQVPLVKDRELFWSVNVQGTDNLLEICLNSGVRKVIHISSSAIYGVPKKNPVYENLSPTPMEEYGKAKFAAEKVISNYIKKGLDVTIIRPRTILGHGRLGIFSILFGWIKAGTNIPVLGKGNNVYQFIHSNDLINAIILASEKIGASVYNIGAEEYGTMRDLLQDLIDYAGSSSKIVSLPFHLTIGAMKITSKLGLSPLGDYHSLMYGRELYFDLSKAHTELEWNAKYSNSDMICESYDWYCDNFQNLSKNDSSSKHRSVFSKGILKVLEWL